VPIGITANDASGSIDLNATLVISKNPSPTVNIPASTQLLSFGNFSAPSTLLFQPSSLFKFSFAAETFSQSGCVSGLSYYAITLDNTSLPSWVTFDGSSLQFSGQTPDYHYLIQPPQTFGIQLIASDVEGFAGIALPLEIEVGVHLLVFSPAEMVINATAGADIHFAGLSGNLELDGATASISSVTAQTPTWLNFDNSSFSVIGTAPMDAAPYTITVQATDVYGDTANATILVDFSTLLFNAPIGQLNATIGSSFTFDLSTYCTSLTLK
jgi:axial budding pattern protein 2